MVATSYLGMVKLQGGTGNVCTVPAPSTTRLLGVVAMPRQYMRVVAGATKKVCRRCGRERPIEQFGIRRLSADGRVSYCPDCLALPEVVRRKRTATATHRSERRRLIAEMKARPCMDCDGSFPPVCMQYDHRDPSGKTVKVSRFASAGGTMAAFLAEVAKCDLVCANCHAIRTERRRLEAIR